VRFLGMGGLVMWKRTVGAGDIHDAGG
jgi:hypothetical protein